LEDIETLNLILIKIDSKNINHQVRKEDLKIILIILKEEGIKTKLSNIQKINLGIFLKRVNDSIERLENKHKYITSTKFISKKDIIKRKEKIDFLINIRENVTNVILFSPSIKSNN
jgi:hypothetical protein